MTDSVIREVWKETCGSFYFMKKEHNKIEFYLAGMNISGYQYEKEQEKFRLAGAFLTWWSASKEEEEKRKEKNGLNYLIYGIIIPETDMQRNMMRAGHGARLRRCRTVISGAWMD